MLLVLGLAAAILFGGESLAIAETGCNGEEPLIQSAWEIPRALECGSAPEKRTWRLPVSSWQPGLVTAAVMEVELLKPSAGGNWVALTRFIFDDPKPFGIPFTFQRIRVVANAPSLETPSSFEIDWSDRCEDPGRGLFPGQRFEVSSELPGTAGLCDLSSAEVVLWGARY